MSRRIRVLVVAFAVAALSATAVWAGPGRDADGDPDVPMGAHPRTPASVAHDDSGVSAAPLVAQNGLIGERQDVSWRVALKVYLKLTRAFAR